MKRGRPRHDDILTPREWEVLRLLEERLTNDQIAERLGISLDTAKFHVSEILGKLGVANRREAVAWRVRRVPAGLSLLKGGAFLAGTAAIAAIIYFGLIGLLLRDSPTGTGPMGKIAYIVDGDVWVKQLPNGPETQLTKWGDVRGEPQWSASGEWLSVTREIMRDQPTPPPGLLPGPTGSDVSTWIIDADGKRERQVGDNYVIPDWSPVKDEFLVGAEIQAADGSSRRVVLVPNNTRLSGAAMGDWTPSGEWIVLTVTKRSTPDMPPTRALVRVRPDGTDEREFYRIEISECEKKSWIARAGSCNPSPTAEGDERIPLSLSAVLTDTQVIGVLQTPDSTLLPLPANPVKTIPLDAAKGVLSGGNVSLGQEYLAYSQASGRVAAVVFGDRSVFLQGRPDAFVDWRIALLESTTGRLAYVAAPGEAADHPAWSPDGRTLFFTAADSSTDAQATGAGVIDSRRIWSADADGGNRKQLTNDPRYRDEYARMTPDGTSILFTRIDLETEGNAASLWLLELATGKLTRVVDDFERPEQLQAAWERLFDWWRP